MFRASQAGSRPVCIGEPGSRPRAAPRPWPPRRRLDHDAEHIPASAKRRRSADGSGLRRRRCGFFSPALDVSRPAFRRCRGITARRPAPDRVAAERGCRAHRAEPAVRRARTRCMRRSAPPRGPLGERDDCPVRRALRPCARTSARSGPRRVATSSSTARKPAPGRAYLPCRGDVAGGGTTTRFPPVRSRMTIAVRVVVTACRPPSRRRRRTGCVCDLAGIAARHGSYLACLSGHASAPMVRRGSRLGCHRVGPCR